MAHEAFPGTMSTDIQLTSGRIIVLKELHQASVYERILEGLPTHADNTRLTADFVAQIAQRFRLPVELLSPSERVLDRPADFRGQPMVIPTIACAGRFLSFKPSRDSSMHGSQLVVVWFQDEFGLAEQEPLDRLKTINWDANASDFMW